tara:strand:+ start:239 stop:439 length:201 start_codon:yes stop_codon:yes gene_type:complete
MKPSKKKAIIRGVILGGALFAYLTFAASMIGHNWQFTGQEAFFTYAVWPIIGFLCFWITAGADICD